MNRLLTKLILIVGVFIVCSGMWACFDKHIGTQENIQADFDAVKECAGVSGDMPVRVITVQKENQPEPGKVNCGDLVSRGCYNKATGTITMPVNGKRNVLKHEMLHHILWVTTGDSDGDHSSPLWQKCGGLTVVGDVE